MGNTITIVGAAGKMGKWFFDYFINIKKGYYNLENSRNIIIDKIIQPHILSARHIIAHVKITFSIYPKKTRNNCRHIKTLVPEYNQNFKNNSH